MPDDSAFERQIEVVLGRMGGPEPTFDAMAIARAAAVPSSRWRFPSVVGATRFVVAGLIVAVFGGLLLAMVLTQPRGDEMAPAAETDSPSPPTTEELLSGMVTEAVEPGVLRIVNDGARDLRWIPTNPDDRAYCCHYENNLALGPDGSAWFFRPEGFFRLGSAPGYPVEARLMPSGDTETLEYEAGFVPWGEIGVTTETWEYVDSSEYEDGTPYDVTVLWGSDAGSLIQANVGPEHDGRWGSDGPGSHVAVDRSGTVWVTTQDMSGRITLSHSDGRGPWNAHDFPGEGGYVEGLWATDEGVWLLHGPGGGAIETDFSHLWRFDGSQWHELEDPTIDHVDADVGQDGTVWMRWDVTRRQQTDDGWTVDPTGAVKWARHDDQGWTTFDAPDDLPRLSSPHDGGGQFDVAPDGSLWFTPHDDSAGPYGDCDGLARFDGAALRRFLPGLCLYNLAIGPDGSVWALAGADYWEEKDPPVETYVIPAEVAMVDR